MGLSLKISEIGMILEEEKKEAIQENSQVFSHCYPDKPFWRIFNLNKLLDILDHRLPELGLQLAQNTLVKTTGVWQQVNEISYNLYIK